MAVFLVTSLHNLWLELLYQSLSFVTSVVVLFAILHRLGILQRAIHRLAERQVSVLLLNGAPVTAAKVEIDWITNKVFVTDAIVHSPDREKWKWDSPLIARFGKVYVHASFLSLLDPVAQLIGYKWRDIHQVYVEDVQVFVEKRRNVYNFHLLDDSLDIPDPTIIMAEFNIAAKGQRSNSSRGSNAGDPGSSPPSPNQRPFPTKRLEVIVSGDASTSSSDCASPVFEDASVSDKDVDLSFETTTSAVEGDSAEKKANEIVTSMLKTVSQLGKAANEGGKEGLERAFKTQRDGFVNRLRQFQERTIEANTTALHTNATASPHTTEVLVNRRTVSGAAQNNERMRSMELMAMESMKVMRQVGKAVEKNVTEIQQSLRPPEKKKSYNGKYDILRIGYIVFKDVRIFTKGVILSSSTSIGVKNSPSDKGVSGRQDASSGSGTPWSKPILLKEVAFGAMDLCNPTSVKDEDGMPLIGMKADKLIDVMIKRAIAEMAKSNTGRLLNNAFGEVLSWMDGGGNSSNKP